MFSGKCFSRGVEVLRLNGRPVRVEEVQVGDLLLGDDSAPRTVISTVHGETELFEITQSFAEPYTVTGDHILVLKCCHALKKLTREKGRSPRWRVRWLEKQALASRSFSDSAYGGETEAEEAARAFFQTITPLQKGSILEISVKDYVARSREWQSLFKGFAVGVDSFVPEVESLPVDPYFLGLWLGDGDASCSRVHNTDDEVIFFLTEEAQRLGLKLTVNDDAHHLSSGQPGKSNPLLTALRQLDVLGNKHIPWIYLTAPRQQRLQLLAGLIDSDGWYEPDKHILGYSSKSESLIDQVARLARSLGLRASKSTCKKTCTNAPGGPKTGTYFGLTLSGAKLHTIPVRVSRKKVGRHVPRNDLLSSITVTSIGRGEYFGFTTDGNNRVLLSDFTVTHNSGEAIRRLTLSAIAGQKVRLFKPSIDDRDHATDVISRGGGRMSAAAVTSAQEILVLAGDADVVGIDEVQFFNEIDSDGEPLIVKVALELAASGKRVIVSGLDLDYRREPFGPMPQLLVRAAFVDKLQSVCHRCGGPACYTQRLVDGKPAPFSGELIIIGDTESYEARCPGCFQVG